MGYASLGSAKSNEMCYFALIALLTDMDDIQIPLLNRRTKRMSQEQAHELSMASTVYQKYFYSWSKFLSNVKN